MKFAKRFFFVLFTAIIPCFAQHYEILPMHKQMWLAPVEETLSFTEIRGGGLNQKPRPFNPETDLSQIKEN